MGEIYRAEDTKLGQPVALKFVRGTLSPALERLYAEVRIGRQVSHLNLCRLYDVAEFEGETFLTMEYGDGEDLGRCSRASDDWRPTRTSPATSARAWRRFTTRASSIAT